jgi:hypothetical protein
VIDTTAIIQGVHDNDLDRIETACRERRRLLREVKTAMTMATVEVGSRVRIKSIRPKYLIGATAVVTGKRRTKLEVRFENTHRRYRAGMVVIVPSSCVEMIGE